MLVSLWFRLWRLLGKGMHNEMIKSCVFKQSKSRCSSYAEILFLCRDIQLDSGLLWDFVFLRRTLNEEENLVKGHFCSPVCPGPDGVTFLFSLCRCSLIGCSKENHSHCDSTSKYFHPDPVYAAGYDCSAGKKCFSESVVMGRGKVSKSVLSILIS